jgi:DUF1365 family protein
MKPVVHKFNYRIFMMYLDLAELPGLFRGRWFWSAHKPALARFRREDHFGDPAIPVDRAVRGLVEQKTGTRPIGPIRLLTHLSYFGYVFNPVSFYYCFNQSDTELETIVAEVNNTPWGERHCYVLPQSMNHGSGDRKRYFPAKVMHVSPFMQMDVEYDWRFNSPGDELTVHMENARGGNKIFDATMVLQREDVTSGSLARILLTYPLLTLKIIAAIHWQAMKLWLKGAPFHHHPGKIEPPLEEVK